MACSMCQVARAASCPGWPEPCTTRSYNSPPEKSCFKGRSDAPGVNTPSWQIYVGLDDMIQCVYLLRGYKLAVCKPHLPCIPWLNSARFPTRRPQIPSLSLYAFQLKQMYGSYQPNMPGICHMAYGDFWIPTAPLWRRDSWYETPCMIQSWGHVQYSALTTAKHTSIHVRHPPLSQFSITR